MASPCNPFCFLHCHGLQYNLLQLTADDAIEGTSLTAVDAFGLLHHGQNTIGVGGTDAEMTSEFSAEIDTGRGDRDETDFPVNSKLFLVQGVRGKVLVGVIIRFHWLFPSPVGLTVISIHTPETSRTVRAVVPCSPVGHVPLWRSVPVVPL